MKQVYEVVKSIQEAKGTKLKGEILTKNKDVPGLSEFLKLV